MIPGTATGVSLEGVNAKFSLRHLTSAAAAKGHSFNLPRASIATVLELNGESVPHGLTA